MPGNDESFIKGTSIFIYTSKQCLSYIWSIVTLDNTSQGKTAMLIYEWNDFNRIGMVNNETGQVCYQKGNSSSRMIHHG